MSGWLLRLPRRWPRLLGLRGLPAADAAPPGPRRVAPGGALFFVPDWPVRVPFLAPAAPTRPIPRGSAPSTPRLDSPRPSGGRLARPPPRGSAPAPRRGWRPWTSLGLAPLDLAGAGAPGPRWGWRPLDLAGAGAPWTSLGLAPPGPRWGFASPGSGWGLLPPCAWPGAGAPRTPLRVGVPWIRLGGGVPWIPPGAGAPWTWLGGWRRLDPAGGCCLPDLAVGWRSLDLAGAAPPNSAGDCRRPPRRLCLPPPRTPGGLESLGARGTARSAPTRPRPKRVRGAGMRGEAPSKGRGELRDRPPLARSRTHPPYPTVRAPPTVRPTPLAIHPTRHPPRTERNPV
jgi:hypothetical protein